MAQNINLHLRPRPRLFSRPGAVVMGVLLLFAGGLWQATEYRQLQQLRADVARSKKDIDRLEKMLGKNPGDAASSMEKLAAEQHEIAALESVVARLATRATSTDIGFAGHLRSLARSSADGVWLTRIRIDKSNGSLTLEGSALESALIPSYLAGLSRDPLLSGTRFAAMDIKETELAGRPVLRFKLDGGDEKLRPADALVAAALNAPSGSTPGGVAK